MFSLADQQHNVLLDDWWDELIGRSVGSSTDREWREVEFLGFILNYEKVILILIIHAFFFKLPYLMKSSQKKITIFRRPFKISLF